MNLFDELERQYNDIDNEYSILEFEANNKNWVQKASRYRKKRKLNDQAYFLFMFTRLEERITEQSSNLISRKKKNLSSWKQRAPWDILSSKISFKNRLALLTEKSTTDYNLVVEYYKERNSIAHGGDFTTSISMPTVIPEFKRLYRILKA